MEKTFSFSFFDVTCPFSTGFAACRGKKNIFLRVLLIFILMYLMLFVAISERERVRDFVFFWTGKELLN